MRLESAQIENFTSIGKENNVLYIERDLTALIGKNESGKSNVLAALGLLDLLRPLSPSYTKRLTRGQGNLPVVSLMLSFTQADQEVYPNAKGITNLIYCNTDVSIKGGLSELIAEDEKLALKISKLMSAIKNNDLKLNNTQLNNIKTRTAKLSSVAEKVHVTIFAELDTAKSDIKASAVDNKIEYIEIIDEIKSSIRGYYNLIPQTYYRKSDSLLKDSYSFEEIKKIYDGNETDRDNDVFYNMMKVAGIDKETLFGAFSAATDPAKRTFERKIADKISDLISKFNAFYGQEEINMEFDIVSNTAKLYITTADMYMFFSERSNGLKWYFSLFVDIKAKTSADRPIVLLLDEPGVYLHVRAQKALLELFSDLSKTGTQIIYTTHSPFMINSNNVFNIRAIEKGKDGLTKIYRSVNNSELNKDSKMETLSPLIAAFGMDLSHNLGPQYEKSNIVVEGITDAMYLTAMMNYLEVESESRPNIIPCAGVDNVHLLVSILIGWGCKYRVLLDFDTQGYTQYEKIAKKSPLTEESNVVFVNLNLPKNKNDVKAPNSATIESLVASIDNEKLVNKYDGTNDTKTLAAKEFLDRVTTGDILPHEATVNSFSKLFAALGILSE